MVGQIVPQNEHGVKDVLKRIEAIRERNRKDYEALARMMGMTIAEIEADLTAPDPGLEEECADEYCGEDVYRDGLCLKHFIAVETAAWDDKDAEREMILETVGYVFGDSVEVLA